MFKYLPFLFLCLTSVANAGAEVSYLNCSYLYQEGSWKNLSVTLQTRPFVLAPRETQVMEAAAYKPIEGLDSPGITRCSELVGTSTDKFIIKTHFYKFEKFEKFADNSCKPLGEGIEFIQMNADLIGPGKPYFAEMAFPWDKNSGNRTVFNVITGEQARKLSQASDEQQNQFYKTLCDAQRPW